MDETRRLLEGEFKMTFQGAPTKCLGIEITQDREKGETKLGLSRHTNDLLTTFGMENSRRKIRKETKEEPILDGEAYRKLVGSLIYLASRTRPNISCAVRAVCLILQKHPG